MTTAARSLSRVHARDIMSNKVFKLDPTATLEEAVAAFSELHISGAPVVDRMGRLVGVLSAYDIAKPENVQSGGLKARQGNYELSDISPDDDGSYDEDVVFSMEDYSPEVLRTGTVADFMTPEVICVAPGATLREVCKQMVKEHIHRVMVVDEGKLVGIVTSLDVVRCLSDALI